jgi:hypothetical protein
MRIGDDRQLEQAGNPVVADLAGLGEREQALGPGLVVERGAALPADADRFLGRVPVAVGGPPSGG